MFTKRYQQREYIDVENPLHDNFIESLNILRSEIQEIKQSLDPYLKRISSNRQMNCVGVSGIISMLSGCGLFSSDLVLHNQLGITGIIGVVLMLGSPLLSIFLMYIECGGSFMHKFRCIKYPPLNELLYYTGDIKEVLIKASFHFPSIQPLESAYEDIASVWRKLNYAEKVISRELKIGYKKRGKETLNVLTKVGLFARDYGPVQKTILDYYISDESIVNSLVIPPRK